MKRLLNTKKYLPLGLVGLLLGGELYAQGLPDLPPAEDSFDELPPFEESFEDYVPGEEGRDAPVPTNPRDVSPPGSNPSTNVSNPNTSTQLPGNGLPSNSQPGVSGIGLPEGLPLPPPQEIGSSIEGNSGSFALRDAPLNDVIELLAEEANRQYFHNPRIATEEFLVTGRLLEGDPIANMEQLALQYGLQIYVKGNTVLVLTPEQLVDLPSKEWFYELKYLRPGFDEENPNYILNLVREFLTPGTGIVNFEPKTNTIFVIDSPQRIELVKNFFAEVDRPQEQICVEVKLLSVNSTAASQLGVSWASTLGEAGLDLGVIASLSDLFGVANSNLGIPAGTTGGSNFILDPLQLNGVLRALNNGDLVTQKSNPVVITENNETAAIGIIDRVPIITTQVTQGTATSQVTEEVRYTIDDGDPSGDLETTREIGITLSVTPSLGPDGTIRLDMRPRSAQIVGEVLGQSGNIFPQVSEASVETIARVPNGHSLIVGGFFGEQTVENEDKVPVLGDLPLLNFFFKSKSTEKVSSSLIFVVTPTAYDAESHARVSGHNQRIRQALTLPSNHDMINPEIPGRAHEADFCRSMQAIRRDLNRDLQNARQ